MLRSLAETAWRHPRAVVGAGLATLVVLVVPAWGASGALAPGSTALDEPAAQVDVLVVTRGSQAPSSNVYAVALDTLAAGVAADPAVASVRRGISSDEAGIATIEVSLKPADESERQAAVEWIASQLDPGPLEVAVGGGTAERAAARSELADSLWKLELLALPVVLLALAATLGPRLGAAPLLVGALAIAGALASLRVAGWVADPSLLAIVPAAVIAVVLAVELPALVATRWRLSRAAGPTAAAEEALAGARPGLAAAALVAALAPLGLVATTLDQALSIILACAVAAGLAYAAAMVVMPALLALEAARPAREASRGGRYVRDLARAPRTLSATPARLRAAIVAPIAVMAWLALISLGGDGAGLTAADLPPDSSPAQVSAWLAEAGAAVTTGTGGSLFEELPLAGLLSAALLAIAFSARARWGLAIPLALGALLPAGAACGLLALFYESVESGALACVAAALVAISAARTATAVAAAAEARELLGEAGARAERAGALTLPAAVASTLVLAATTLVLLAVDLAPIRQLAVGVALGALLDLLLVRAPLLAVLARTGTGLDQAADAPARRRIAWPRWRQRAKTASGTDSAS